MSTEERKQLIFGLVDEVWSQHEAAALDRYFGPGLREEVAGHCQQLLRGFPDLLVRIEDDPIAEGDKVVARLTLMGTPSGTFAGRDASGHLARWSSIRVYRIDDGKVAEIDRPSGPAAATGQGRRPGRDPSQPRSPGDPGRTGRAPGPPV